MSKQSTFIVAVAFGALGAVACASAGTAGTAAARSAKCPSLERDTVYSKAEAVYRDCAVDQKARQVNAGTRPDFRPTNMRTGCYSAELEFVVDRRGIPETGTAIVLQTNERAFADAVMATLSSWRYEPAKLGGVAVRQIVSEKRTAATTVTVGGAPPPSQRAPRC